MCYVDNLHNAVYAPKGNKTEVGMLNFLYSCG